MKKVAVTYGVHGDERSSLLLVKKIQAAKIPNANIDIHGPINKEAWNHGKRYIDSDLNRIFDGSGKGHEATLVKPTLELLKEYDLVIDIHTFRMKSLLTSVNFGHNNYASSLPVDIVWDVEDKTRYKGTLATQLEKRGTPTLILELSSIASIDNMQIERATHAIKTFLLSFPENIHRTNTQHYKRHLLETKKEGVFVPKAKLMSYVQRGTILGEIHSSKTDTIVINAPCSGTLMQVRHRGWIPSGGSVAAIGNPKT